MVAAAGAGHQQICLELTEGALMDDVPHSEQVMHALKEPGVRLLLVHDAPDAMAALARQLRPNGYRILSAGNGAEGLELMADNAVDIIVTAQRLPGMTGVQFLQRASELQPRTIRVVVSDHSERLFVAKAINAGTVYRCLTIPWDDARLGNAIEQAFHHKALADENEKLNISIRAANQELTANDAQRPEPRGPAQPGHERCEAGHTVVDMPARRPTAVLQVGAQTDVADAANGDTAADWQFADLRERFDATLDALNGDIHDNALLQCDLVEVPAVDCSASKIGQLFERLLAAAARAAGPHGGTIAIRNGTDGASVWFEISGRDSDRKIGSDGTGTPAADPRLASRNGPDLSAADDIVRQHHGTMAVQSAAGQRSSFRVTLPIVQPVFWDSEYPPAP